jgi:hypothetical protein
VSDEPLVTNKTIVSKAQGALWAAQIRREIDLLVQATDGIGASSLFARLATEAVYRDDGTLKTSVGEPGYSWSPDVQERKKSRDPVQQRINAAAASLGRVLGGGQCDHRAYLAFLEAIYQVATSQDKDVSARIEALWERYDQHVVEEAAIEQARRSLLRRVWDAVRNWWAGGVAL